MLLNHTKYKKSKENFKFVIMANNEKNKYSASELVEFEKLILEKMENAQKELDFIKESLLRSNLSGLIQLKEH